MFDPQVSSEGARLTARGAATRERIVPAAAKLMAAKDALVRAVVTHQDQSSSPADWTRRVMTGPQENVKIFGLRPVDAVAGLVPGGRHCVPIMAALPGLGIETDIVGILHGADGLRILDPEPHGIGQKVLKFFESWGYHIEIIKLYDEGLRKGESLVVVPASYPDRVAVGQLMAGNGGHAVYYFGVGHVESLTGP